jgi:hypothetical protein
MGTLAAIFEHQCQRGMEAPVLAQAYTPGLKAQRCAIVHCTQDGACVSSSVELPDMFIMRRIDSRIERICRVVWRDDHLIGVQYVNARTIRDAKGKEVPFDWGSAALFPT